MTKAVDLLEIPAYLRRQENQPVATAAPEHRFVLPSIPPRRRNKRPGVGARLLQLGWMLCEIKRMSPGDAESRAALGNRPDRAYIEPKTKGKEP